MMYGKCTALVVSILSCLSVVLASSCSQKTLEEESKACVNEWYDAIKKDPAQKCRKLFNSKIKTCIRNFVDDCQNNTDSKTLSSIISRSKRFISSWEYYCEDGMLDSFKGSKKLQNCREKALEKVEKCASSFHKKFKENKGSRSLCRKFSKAKKCIKRTLERNCQKTPWVQNAVKLYQNPYNPYCPGRVDPAPGKRVRSISRRLGSCSEMAYLSLTRVCIASFVFTLRKNPKTSCRRAYIDKINNCAKNVALHCYKNESKYDRKNVEKSFNSKSFRYYQEQVYCNGLNLKVSLPPLKRHQCAKNFISEKEKCEANYVRTYRKNKADKTLCREYAEAKGCVKNVTLTLCRITQEQEKAVNFFCDTFNPFCFNMSDPPIVKQSRASGQRVPRETSPQLSDEPSDHAKGNNNVKSSGRRQSVGFKSYLFVLVSSLVVLIWTCS